MTLDFVASDHGTLGIEFEADLVDATTLQRAPLATDVTAKVQQNLRRGSINPDLFESTIEFSTGICVSLDQAMNDFQEIYATTKPELERRQLKLLGMGLHPFAAASESIAARGSRYQDIMKRIAWPARQISTNALQVHIGMPSGDHAIAVATTLRPVLPVLLALSASSPFRSGEVTGLASTRAALFASVPRSGPMPNFNNYAHYVSFCEAMIRADAIPTELHTWWDCRLQPSLGTLELRITESVADLNDIAALSALAWCMGVGAQHLNDFHLPTEFSDENRWRAIRFGSDASFLVSPDGATQPLHHLVTRLITALSSTATDLGCLAELERCEELAKGTSRHQRLTTNDEDVSSAELANRAATEMLVNW